MTATPVPPGDGWAASAAVQMPATVAGMDDEFLDAAPVSVEVALVQMDEAGSVVRQGLFFSAHPVFEAHQDELAANPGVVFDSAGDVGVIAPEALIDVVRVALGAPCSPAVVEVGELISRRIRLLSDRDVALRVRKSSVVVEPDWDADREPGRHWNGSFGNRRVLAFADRLVRAALAVNAPSVVAARVPRQKFGDWERRARQLLSQAGQLVIALEPVNAIWTVTADFVVFDGCRVDDVTEVVDRQWRDVVCQVWSDAPSETPIDGAVISPEAVVSLLDKIGRLDDFGVLVQCPSGLRRRRSGSVRRQVTGSAPTLTSETLMLSSHVVIDDVSLTADELSAAASALSPLVCVNGTWKLIDDRTLGLIRAAAESGTTTIAANQLMFADDIDDIDVDGWVGDVLRGERWELWQPQGTPEGFCGELRPHQQLGLGWLGWLERNYLGGVLADDMGIGKTAQTIAAMVANPGGQTLVICPVVAVDTWTAELARFAPQLSVQVHHSSNRGAVEDLAADVIVTTFDTLVRDVGFRARPWKRVVVDEAQGMKNPDSKRARAIFELDAEHRVALTGTPVENSTVDMWSIMHFANPGLLGGQRPFRRAFGALDPKSPKAEMLSRVIAPFTLRRLKTDPGVVDELPSRTVRHVHCGLTRTQRDRYEAYVEAMLEEVGQATTRGQRRMHMLAGIGRLRQICVAGELVSETRRSLVESSGKIRRLVEICADNVAAGEATVVFCEYASLLPRMAQELSAELGVAVSFYTGSMSRSERKVVVDEFNRPDGPPVILMSLLAAGSSLNLVRANHVVHLNRWWNPAKEDQASDRVWRIGQTREVTVSLLWVPGTLEERINMISDHKRELADSLVSARGLEAAVTEMSESDLRAFVDASRALMLEEM